MGYFLWSFGSCTGDMPLGDGRGGWSEEGKRGGNDFFFLFLGVKRDVFIHI